MKSRHIVDFFIGITFALFFISLAIILVLHCRPLYYNDIAALNIEENTNIDREIIKKNYDVLIDYCTSSGGELSFPNFKSSEKGLEHFKDVQDLFNLNKIVCIVTFVICCIVIFRKTRKNYQDFRFLLISSIVAITLPLILGLSMLMNFDKLFLNFHELFFSNDYYLFNVEDDPIITILPEDFFMHCGLFITAFSILGGICMFIIWKELNKRYIVTES